MSPVMTRMHAALFGLALASSATHAQTQFELRDAINAARDRGDDAAFIAASRALLERNPDRGDVWSRLGTTLLVQGRYDESIAALERAVALRDYPGEAMYNIACGHALAGRPDHALAALTKSIDLRFTERHQLIRTDPDLDALRDDPRFVELVRTTAPAGLTRDAGWRYDIDALAHLVRWFHHDHDHVLPAAEFDRRVADLAARVPGLTDQAVILEMLALLAALGDAHSGLPLPWDEPYAMRIVPYALRDYADGVFVAAAAPEHRRIVGARVVAIGGVPIETAIARVNVLVADDDGNTMLDRTEGLSYLAVADALHWLDLAETPDGVTLDVELRDGIRHRETLAARRRDRSAFDAWPTITTLVDAAPPLHRRNRRAPYWHTWLAEDRVVYCQYNACRDDPDGPTVRDYVADLFAFIEARDVDALVLDIRHNGGGSSDLNWPFTHRLALHPRLNDPERLFVITGPGTGSAASIFTGHLEYHTRATFVGEPPCEPPVMIAEGGRLRLPWSGLDFHVSTRYFQAVSGTRDVRFWIAPHVRIKPTSDDVVEHRDPVMDAILTRVRSRPG